LLLIAFLWLYPLLLRRAPLPPNPLNLPLLLFTFMLGVAILITADPELTLPKATGLILGLTAWRYLVCHIRTPVHLRNGLLLLGGLGLAFVGMGLLAADWMFKVPGIQEIVSLLPDRLLALPGADGGVHTNQLAGTMLPFLPLLLSLVLGWSTLQRQRLLLLGLLLVTTAVFILTQSRTGYLGAVGGWLLLGLLWAGLLPPSPQRHWLHLGLLLLVAAGLLGVWGVGSERLLSLWADPRQETVVGTVGSLSFRQEVWRWSLVAIGDFPFTGTGLGTFRQVVRRFYPLAITPTYDIAHAHNIFLQTALDVGLPGLIAYLSLVGLALQQGWQAARRSLVLRPAALGLIAGMVALHIFGLADALALGSKPALLFWVMLGLLAVLPRLEQNGHLSHNNKPITNH
jgi:putative inorganic carbon (hco3(-)) transporter